MGRPGAGFHTHVPLLHVQKGEPKWPTWVIDGDDMRDMSASRLSWLRLSLMLHFDFRYFDLHFIWGGGGGGLPLEWLLVGLYRLPSIQ